MWAVAVFFMGKGGAMGGDRDNECDIMSKIMRIGIGRKVIIRQGQDCICVLVFI